MVTMKTEYQKQIRNADKKIAELETQRDQLLEQVSHLKIDQLGVANQILKQKNEIDIMIHAAEVMRQAARDQIIRWDKNKPEATSLIEQARLLHEHARGIYGRFPGFQEDVKKLMKELDADKNKMGALSAKFRELIGEDLNLPFQIECYQAAAFAAAQPIKPDAYPAWKYTSETELTAQRDEELQMRLQAHEKRLKMAEEHAPDCPICARGNVQTKMIVDRRSGHDDTPGQAGSGHSSHHWYFVCPKCGATMTQPIPETKK
jgi:chromosome segregation ATPase